SRKTDAILSSKFKGYMTPYEVIRYLVDTSAWGAKERAKQKAKNRLRGDSQSYSIDLEAVEEFQRRAQEPISHIRVWGLKNGLGEPSLIPPSFWLTNSFHLSDTITGAANRTSATVSKAFHEREALI